MKFLITTLIAIAPGVFLAVTGGVRIYTFFGVSMAGAGYVESMPLLVRLLAPFISTFFVALSQGISLYGAVQNMRGREFLLGPSFIIGLKRFFPVLGLTIFGLLAVYLGFILLIVPGLMLIVRLFVCLPACVVERLGPIRSFRRSSELTRGHRWKVFGIFVLTMMIASSGTAINVLFSTLAGPEAGICASLASTVLYTAYLSIVDAVTYHDLRVLKDGIDIDRVAAVFD